MFDVSASVEAPRARACRSASATMAAPMPWPRRCGGDLHALKYGAHRTAPGDRMRHDELIGADDPSIAPGDEQVGGGRGRNRLECRPIERQRRRVGRVAMATQRIGGEHGDDRRQILGPRAIDRQRAVPCPIPKSMHPPPAPPPVRRNDHGRGGTPPPARRYAADTGCAPGCLRDADHAAFARGGVIIGTDTCPRTSARRPVAAFLGHTPAPLPPVTGVHVHEPRCPRADDPRSPRREIGTGPPASRHPPPNDRKD